MEKLNLDLTLQVDVSGSCGYLSIPFVVHFRVEIHASIHLLMNF